jgi:hypothetical protein
MASVIRINAGGSTTMEKIGLSLEQARELAARLREAGEPPGCAWCVGLDEEEEEANGHIQERRYKTVRAMRLTLTVSTVMVMASTWASLTDYWVGAFLR